MRSVPLEDVAAKLFDNAPYAPFRNTHGKTALMLAAGEGQMEAVKVLLELGASVEAKDSAGFTPLHYAAGAFWQESTEIVELILAKCVKNSAHGPIHFHHDVAKQPAFALPLELVGNVQRYVHHRMRHVQKERAVLVLLNELYGPFGVLRC